MKRGVVFQLLSDLLEPNAAKVANPQHPCGSTGHAGISEAVRTSAIASCDLTEVTCSSQAVSSASQGSNPQEDVVRQGRLQHSQDSQARPMSVALLLATDAVIGTWTDADIQRFHDRQNRLLRWGWTPDQAEAMAERLTCRDRAGDPRVSCLECACHQPGRCANPSSALLSSGELSADLAALLQHCPGFRPIGT